MCKKKDLASYRTSLAVLPDKTSHLRFLGCVPSGITNDAVAQGVY